MNTPVDLIKPIFDQELVDNCRTIKAIYEGDPSDQFTNIEIKTMETLNKIFMDYTCVSVICNNNTDKVLFGVYVDPTITDSDAINIIIGTDTTQLTRYSVEIDLKLFEKLDEVEVASYIVEEIASIMNPSTINKVRSSMDLILMDQDDSIEIKSSVNYTQVLIFGIKDSIKRIAGLLYKPESEVAINDYSKAFGIENYLLSIKMKLSSIAFDIDNNDGNPKLSVLSWCLMIYKDININYRLAEEILLKALAVAGSSLEKKEITKTINSVKRALSEIVAESTINNVVDILNEKGISLFQSLKRNGLRSIEDDLYEYKIRLKNCETQEDALYILRQINTRISILEDYIANTDLSESEEERWRNVAMAYRALRDEIGKKKISYKKNYGIFVDYDKIDALED